MPVEAQAGQIRPQREAAYAAEQVEKSGHFFPCPLPSSAPRPGSFNLPFNALGLLEARQ
jgi:hypothetical protein